MSWTDERVELLKKMWNEGHSASQIAKELGGVTRNAVIGKVHRLGLSNRSGPETAAEAAPPPAASAKPAPAREEAPVVDLAEAKAARAASRPAPEPAPAPPAPERPDPAAATEDVEDAPVYKPRAIIPAGQPLPPQPSTNEID
ncbi:MAG: GcrA cell cycle regulator, partial [Rhodobacteraceae bacterium]